MFEIFSQINKKIKGPQTKLQHRAKTATVNSLGYFGSMTGKIPGILLYLTDIY